MACTPNRRLGTQQPRLEGRRLATFTNALTLCSSSAPPIYEAGHRRLVSAAQFDRDLAAVLESPARKWQEDSGDLSKPASGWTSIRGQPGRFLSLVSRETRGLAKRTPGVAAAVPGHQHRLDRHLRVPGRSWDGSTAWRRDMQQWMRPKEMHRHYASFTYHGHPDGWELRLQRPPARSLPLLVA